MSLDSEKMAGPVDAAHEPVHSSALLVLRHDLRTLLDQIVGYSELIRPAGTGAVPDRLTRGLDEIRTIARGIVARLDVTSTGLVSDRHLQVFGRRLVELGAQMCARATELVTLTHADGREDEIADVAQLQHATENLLALARRLGTDGPTLAADRSVAQALFSGWSDTAAAAAATTDEREAGGLLLVVDDDEGNRQLLARRLDRFGYSTWLASGGREALDMLERQPFDLVLLDVMMPEIDGFAVLNEIKQHPRLRDVPVLMISAVDDASSVVRCIKNGADDYLPKPFDPVILRARIHACLDRKRLRDKERRRTLQLAKAIKEIDRARQLSDNLLQNILPEAVATELREKGRVEPMYFEDVTIGLTDFVGFTSWTEKLSAEELVSLLHEYFSAFDRIVERYALEKLKTIGDAYLFTGGLPVHSRSHPVDVVLAAFEMIRVLEQVHDAGGGVGWQMRVGVHTGSLIAGVVGIRKFAFDVWGEPVNLTFRMQANGISNQINASGQTYARIKDFFLCEPHGKVSIVGAHDVEMYTVRSVLPSLLAPDPTAFARRYHAYFKKDPPISTEHLVAEHAGRAGGA